MGDGKESAFFDQLSVDNTSSIGHKKPVLISYLWMSELSEGSKTYPG